MLYKYIKLTSGDDIIAATEDKCDTFIGKEFIKISKPVKIGTISFPRNGAIFETVVFMPWVAVAAVEEMQLPIRNIVLAVDIQEPVAEMYQKFISKVNRTIDKNEITSHEEYIEVCEDDDELEEDEEEDNNDVPRYH